MRLCVYLVMGGLCMCVSGCFLALPVVIAIAQSEGGESHYEDLAAKPWYNPEKSRDQAVQDVNECWFAAAQKYARLEQGRNKAWYEVDEFKRLIKKRGYRRLSQDMIPPDATIETVGYVRVVVLLVHR